MLCPTNGLHQPEHWPRLLHVVIPGFPAAEEGQPNAQALSKPPQASHVLTNHWPKPAIGTKLKPKDCRIIWASSFIGFPDEEEMDEAGSWR